MKWKKEDVDDQIHTIFFTLIWSQAHARVLYDTDDLAIQLPLGETTQQKKHHEWMMCYSFLNLLLCRFIAIVVGGGDADE